MNWDAIGAIGQMLGSLAVFITLGYLAVQVRHARSDSRRALSQGRAEGIRDFNSMFCDEKIVTIWTKAMIALETPLGGAAASLTARAKLTPEEALMAVTVARTMWANVIQTIPNVHELPAVERTSFDESIRLHYGANGGPSRIFYEAHIKSRAHPDAVRYIDNVLGQPS